MRLDKFLKISRIIKRRTVAKEVAVEELHESTKKDDAAKMYRIISETRVENNGN